MKNHNQITWVSDKDLINDPVFLAETESEVNQVAIDTLLEDERTPELTANRRDFLKLLGFGISAATMASCEIPVKRAIPYVIAPDEIVPGIANYYASSFVNGRGLHDQNIRKAVAIKTKNDVLCFMFLQIYK